MALYLPIPDDKDVVFNDNGTRAFFDLQNIVNQLSSEPSLMEDNGAAFVIGCLVETIAQTTIDAISDAG